MGDAHALFMLLISFSVKYIFIVSSPPFATENVEGLCHELIVYYSFIDLGCYIY